MVSGVPQTRLPAQPALQSHLGEQPRLSVSQQGSTAPAVPTFSELRPGQGRTLCPPGKRKPQLSATGMGPSLVPAIVPRLHLLGGWDPSGRTSWQGDGGRKKARKAAIWPTNRQRHTALA